MQLIRPDGLTHNGWVPFYIEKIVNYLEGKSNVFSVRSQVLDLLIGAFSDLAARLHCGFDKCSGFEPMHAFELILGEFDTFEGQISSLAFNHPPATSSIGDYMNDVQP